MTFPFMRLVFVAGVFWYAGPVIAQDGPNDVHRLTVAPENARFEIIQSQLAVKWTFKLDRYAGRIYQLVRTSEEKFTWQEMKVYGNAGRASDRPRFQLFLSGIAVRNTFLIDTDTGQTWQLVAAKVVTTDGKEEEVHVWSPLEG